MASSKLSAKAARLDFSSLPGTGAPVSVVPAAAPDAHQRPKTAPGAMMAYANDARSELMRENEQLRSRAADVDQVRGALQEALGDLAQWDGAKAARLIDPSGVAPSRFANRHESNYTGPEYTALRAEIESAGGNVQPIKVRRLASPGPGPVNFEVVFGHRRHRACLELGLPVLAVIDNLDDRALFVEMDRENRARKDLSAWEQGMMYRRALSQGLFPSNRKLAEATGVDLGAVGKALALAGLPDEVITAFASPLDLQFRWAKPLNDALAADVAGLRGRAAAMRTARGPRTARQVFEHLLGRGMVGVEPFNPPPPVVLKVAGKRVATAQAGPAGAVTISIDPGALPAKRLPGLVALIEAFLASDGSDSSR